MLLRRIDPHAVQPRDNFPLPVDSRSALDQEPVCLRNPPQYLLFVHGIPSVGENRALRCSASAIVPSKSAGNCERRGKPWNVLRNFAASCFDLARKAASLADRTRLLVVAEGWLDLIDRTRRLGRRQVSGPEHPEVKATLGAWEGQEPAGADEPGLSPIRDR